MDSILKLESQEQKRIQTLHSLNLLDTAQEAEFESIVELVKSSLNAEMAAISLIDTDRQWFKAVRGLSVSETPRSVAFCDHTIRKDDVLVVENALEDERFEENPFVTDAPGVRCYLGAPLIMPNGQRIGSMCIIGTEPRIFTDAEKQMIQSFAALVVSQIELRQIASTDGLTGMMTRTAFVDQLGVTITRLKNTDIEACLMMLDIDHFKSINDTFGHAVGDRVIQAVASIVMSNCRGDDRAGRLGGEEFGLLLRGVRPDAMTSVAERIKIAVDGLSMDDIPTVKVTISIGIAPLDHDVTNSTDWLAAADERLYRAKRSGRNKIVAA